MDMARATIVFLLLAMVCAGGTTPLLPNDVCPITDTAVFPFFARCDKPAQYEQSYRLWAPQPGNRALWLAPVWNGTTHTHDIHLAGRPTSRTARYVFSLTLDNESLRPYVALHDPLYIVNLSTRRVLAWRYEDGRYLLVEVPESDTSHALFQFGPYDSPMPVSCTETDPPHVCKGYTILDYNSTSGLALYNKNGVTYLQKSTTSLVGIGLTPVPINLPLHKDI